MGNNSTKHRSTAEPTPRCFGWIRKVFRSLKRVKPEPEAAAAAPSHSPEPDVEREAEVEPDQWEVRTEEGHNKTFNVNDLVLEDIEEYYEADPELYCLSPVTEETEEELYEDDVISDDKDDRVVDNVDVRCLSPTPPDDLELDIPDIYENDDQRPLSSLAKGSDVRPGYICPNNSRNPMPLGARFNPGFKSSAYQVPVTFGVHINEAMNSQLEIQVTRVQRYCRMKGVKQEKPTVMVIQRLKEDGGQDT